MGSRVIVASVPNCSEGRRGDVIQAILSALRVPGVFVVGDEPDREHNRLDATVIGPPDAVRRSVLGAAGVAVRLIDMDQHRGGHPRMGAVDVIPFVPLRGGPRKAVAPLNLPPGGGGGGGGKGDGEGGRGAGGGPPARRGVGFGGP